MLLSFQQSFEIKNKTNMFRKCKAGCRRCCPNGFCGCCKPSVQMQKKVDTVTEVEKSINRKDIPYGYVYIYPGNKIFLLLFSSIKRFSYL